MRIFAVVLGVLYALAFSVPTVLWLGGHYGTTGIVKAGALATLPAGASVNTVGDVRPGSPAARAGIVAGDIVVKSETEHAPVFAQIFDLTVAGRPTAYAVVHAGQRREIVLTPVPFVRGSATYPLIVAQLVRGLAIVLIGALLVFLRPSFMTAAFFVLCLEFGELAHPTGNVLLVNALPPFWKLPFLGLTCLVTGGGPAAAAIFCMRFPSGKPLPAWRRAERAMLVVAGVAIITYVAALTSGSTLTLLGATLYRIFSAITLLSYVVATAAFLVRYLHASGEDRDRLRWVAIGLGSFLLSYALFWIAENVPSAPGDLSTWSQFINILPLTVAYAVIRHRVIDVRIAGGRAIAYTILSSVPVMAFSLIDLLVSNQLQQTRLALAAEIGVALGFGFWVNSSQKRIDNLIESVFFHKRRVAEERLRRVARRIGQATERGAIDETLVREPFEALALTAAALYARVDGSYVRGAQRAWPDDVLPLIGANDTLALELATVREPVDVDAIAWDALRSVNGIRPSLAFPIVVRDVVVGLLLLAEKRDGERFDALEQAAVESLVAAAAQAYDHLDAVEQQRLGVELRTALDQARAEIDALRSRLGREPSSA